MQWGHQLGNYGGKLVKEATVKRLVSSEVYCSKLYQLNVVNRELLETKEVVWGVKLWRDYDPGGWEGKRIKIYCSCFVTAKMVQSQDLDDAL